MKSLLHVSTLGVASLLLFAATTVSAQCPTYFNGFETDDAGWNVFGVGYESVRVPSGTNGVTSASGSWHCETVGDAAGNWGGYSAVCGCASTACAGPVSTFPTGGYVTSIDIYLDVGGGFANDSRFDFSSAICDTTGVHRRDFIFNVAFLDSTDLTPPGAGVNRFVIAASNNAPGFPQGGVDPVAITTTGWYTFEHHFRDAGAGVLACDFTVRDSSGTVVASWTRSNASDVIGVTVGGNRYGWFVDSDFSFLAFDNASRMPGPYDQDVTPDAIFGSGNANGSFTVDREDGVELGLRGKLRYPASNIFNSNGDGTYTFNTGSGTGSFPNSEWSFEWSVNTDYDGSSGKLLDDLSYRIGMDNDPGAGTDYLVFDPIAINSVIPYTTPATIPWWDHSMGDNSTPNGGGVEAVDATSYATNLSLYNVAQNSWKPTFYQNTAPYSWNPNVPGRYEYYLAALDGTTEVARTAISIIAVDGITMTLEGDACQTDHDAGTAGIQVAFELWLRNPDDVDVSGYQAFLAYDDSQMTYEGTLSSYSPLPFGSHIQDVVTAGMTAGELRLDGNSFVGAPTDGDALLATLVFTVNECDTNTVDFDLSQVFPSEFSYLGVPYATNLLDSSATVGDVTPPVIGPHGNITQPADAGSCSGAVVTYTAPSVSDNCDTSPTLTCLPASGSTFPVGTTTVTCTATDDCGNESTSTFDVTVTATNTVTVDVELVGVNTPVTRCIHFSTDLCASNADVMVSFIDHDFDGGTLTPVRGTATFEVACGTFTSLCGKDEQHTKWDTVPLTLSGTTWAATSLMSLDGGDTDNDGDVDINDITWFLGQFGGLTVSGGCPYDGSTRDADFSDNGAVGAEDYSFLVDNWLTTSGCVCSLTWAPVGSYLHPQVMVSAVTPLQKRADLNHDGYVDDQDVQIFEIRHGLSGELSSRMRASLR